MNSILTINPAGFDRVNSETSSVAFIQELLWAEAYRTGFASPIYRTLAELDLFEQIGRKILSVLAHAVTERTLTAGACGRLVRTRRQTDWFARHADTYRTIDLAAQFVDLVGKHDLTVHSLADGVRQYGARAGISPITCTGVASTTRRRSGQASRT